MKPLGRMRQWVGPREADDLKEDRLKTQSIFVLSFNLAPVIFHFKDFQEKSRTCFLFGEAFLDLCVEP
jgi:hypothetical protein